MALCQASTRLGRWGLIHEQQKWRSDIGRVSLFVAPAHVPTRCPSIACFGAIDESGPDQARAWRV